MFDYHENGESNLLKDRDKSESPIPIKKPGLPPKKSSSVMRMPNVYLIKELPTQKAIISPRL
jgi:hypothetical protein